MTTTISISRTELLNRLQTVSKIIPAKCTTPIMENVLMEIEDGTIYFSAADYQGRINTSISGILTDNDISFCIEPKLMIEALKILPEQPIAISISESLAIIVKYHGGKFEMVGLDPDEFPTEKNFSEAKHISISSKILLNGIEKTIFCSATDELRPIMTSVYLNIEPGQISFVSSDGHKLALLEIPDESMTDELKLALPLKMANIVKGSIKPSEELVKIFILHNCARFEYGSDSIVVTLLEGNYPNYRSVIPQNNDKVLTIGSSDFKKALKRVSVFANQSSSLVKLDLSDNSIKLSAQDVDYSIAAEEVMECEYTHPQIAIGFKGHFLTELIAAIPTSEMQMSFSKPSSASLITPIDEESKDKLTYLLMPMMLND